MRHEHEDWSSEAIQAHIEKPIPYSLYWVSPTVLTLGFRATHVQFEWRPYESRTPDAQQDLDRLKESIKKNGILAPVIVYGRHVLIGQRRTWIAQELGIPEIHVASIQEPVEKWWKYDIKRLDKLKEELGYVTY